MCTVTNDQLTLLAKQSKQPTTAATCHMLMKSKEHTIAVSNLIPIYSLVFSVIWSPVSEIDLRRPKTGFSWNILRHQYTNHYINRSLADVTAWKLGDSKKQRSSEWYGHIAETTPFHSLNNHKSHLKTRHRHLLLFQKAIHLYPSTSIRCTWNNGRNSYVAMAEGAGSAHPQDISNWTLALTVIILVTIEISEVWLRFLVVIYCIVIAMNPSEAGETSPGVDFATIDGKWPSLLNEWDISKNPSNTWHFASTELDPSLINGFRAIYDREVRFLCNITLSSYLSWFLFFRRFL